MRVFFLLFAAAHYLSAQTDTSAVLAIQESLRLGDLNTASRLLTEFLEKQPKDSGLLNLRGILHAQRNELEEARSDFREAVRFAPALTPAWQNLGRACQQLDDETCAVEAWQRVVRAKPGDGEAHASLALLFEKQSKFAESLRELDLGKVDNLPLRCLDLTSLKRIPEATKVAARLAKQTDFTEGELDRMHGAMDAVQSAQIVAVLAEGLDARGAAGLSSLQRLVVAYENLQRQPDAVKILERVAKLDPNNTAHLLELARLAESSRNFEVALGYLAHALDIEPNNPRIHFLFGLIAGELNLPIEAKQSFDKALAIEPENPDYNYAMGTTILKTRDAASAAAYFEKFVKSRPADARGHYALGLAHFASGNYDKAKQEMKVAANDSGMAAPADYYLGRIARLEGDMDEAMRNLRKSIELMPNFSEPHTELARIALMAGNLENARAELSQALKIAPESFQANEQLLVLYKRTHDTRARKQAELLKQLDEDRSRRAELMLRTIEVER